MVPLASSEIELHSTTSLRMFRRLPHDPRCKLCQNPFAGFGGKVVGLMGRKPSRKNPNLCQACFDRLPSGGIEIKALRL